jgi:hypothetical protein
VEASGRGPRAERRSRAGEIVELNVAVAHSSELHGEDSGHTDDVPIRSAQRPSTFERSPARASRIASELVATDEPLHTRISAVR